MIFDLKLSELAKKIKALKKKPKLVLVQLPEGLKEQVKEISGFLEQELGTTVPVSPGSNEALPRLARQGLLRNSPVIVINAEPCFGACDLALKEAEMLNAGLIVHFGHSDFGLKTQKSVIYWPVEAGFDEVKVAEKISEICKERNWFRTGLGTTIQYLPSIKKLEKSLAEKEIKAYSAQVLGCNYTAVKKLESKVDSFFFVGDGLFHALGMQFAVGKKVLALNPQTLAVKELDSEKDSYYRQRISQISLAKQARTFAILLSTKPGQFNITLALKAKKLIENSGRKAFLFSANFLKAEFFAGLQFDCFVNTACPRIAIEDSAIYGKPVLNFKELEIALGKRRLEEFK